MCASDMIDWEEMTVVLCFWYSFQASRLLFFFSFSFFFFPIPLLFFLWCSDYVWDRCYASSHQPPVAFLPPVWLSVSTAMLFLLKTVWQTLFVWMVHLVALVNKVVFLSRCQKKWWLPHSAPALYHISFLQGTGGCRCHLIFLLADSEMFAIKLRPSASLLWKSCI